MDVLTVSMPDMYLISIFSASEIAITVDFASLISGPKYSNILKGTKYEKKLNSITPFELEA
jgi:hypothetical protein|tara:strand:+ start:793 stop:975 length:183 start_codon:yes stop_codon:yes gene_type:complete